MKTTLDFEAPIVEIEKMVEKLKALSAGQEAEFADQIAELEKKIRERRVEVYRNLNAWQTVQVARVPGRPVLRDYIDLAFTDFLELHGDRRYSDDRAIIGGFARLGDQKVMLIGHNKGRTVEENVAQNFGLALPDGYRKALRLMKVAEKYGLPVVTLIDTQGASPVREAEERGQHEAIARNLNEMSRLQVPIVCVVTGEGGSGGALGIGVGDVVMMLEHAVYSVISPEGCAGILWRDGSYAPQAAEALKPTAASLKKLGAIDEIIPEPAGGAHTGPAATAQEVKKAILKHLKRLRGYSTQRLLHKRFEKLSSIGKFNS